MKKIFKDRTEYYNKLGQRHRDNDLPAVECSNGNKYWYQNDLLHRDKDLPAVEYSNGDKEWYQNGECHRLNGPAFKWTYGGEYWYYQGERIKCSSTEEFIQLIKLRAFW